MKHFHLFSFHKRLSDWVGIISVFKGLQIKNSHKSMMVDFWSNFRLSLSHSLTLSLLSLSLWLLPLNHSLRWFLSFCRLTLSNLLICHSFYDTLSLSLSFISLFLKLSIFLFPFFCFLPLHSLPLSFKSFPPSMSPSPFTLSPFSLVTSSESFLILISLFLSTH